MQSSEEKENSGLTRNKRAAVEDDNDTTENYDSPTTKKFQAYTNDSPPKRTTAPAFTMYKPTNQSPKSVTDKNSPAKVIENPLKLFQTRIGSNIRVDDKSLNTSLNDSVAERIDLHLCNYRATASPTQPRMHESLKQMGFRANKNDHTLDMYDPDQSSLNSSATTLISTIESPSPAPTSIRSSQHTDSTPNSQATPTNNTTSTQVESGARRTVNRCESVDEKTPVSSQASDDVPSSSVDFSANRKTKILRVNLKEYMRQQTERLSQLKLKESHEKDDDEEERKMLSELKFKSKSIDSKDAEAELDRSITKEDFLRMKVCGQFNKGFIITQLDNDLFIVDQHAADEIFNFETLQRTGKIEKQRLLQPIYLELTASSEAILLDNIGLVEKAGFEVQVCSNRKVGNRIMVTCVPISNKSNKLFNTKDIDEILFILSESELNPGSISSSSNEREHLTHIKPSSLRALYASKACRKSVMIGDSLNQKEMRRIVTHLSEIDKPWNCPHGRPTLRHLINVNLLQTSASSSSNQ